MEPTTYSRNASATWKCTLESMLAAKREIESQFPTRHLFSHPNTIRTLGELGRIIHPNEYLPETVKVWKFPDDPLVTYEKSDEVWCRYFGIGREVEEPYVVEVNTRAFDMPLLNWRS